MPKFIIKQIIYMNIRFIILVWETLNDKKHSLLLKIVVLISMLQYLVVEDDQISVTATVHFIDGALMPIRTIFNVNM